MDNQNILFQNPSGQTGGIFCFRKLLFLIAFVWCCGLHQSIKAQARIKVKDAKLNFGFVKRGRLIKNEFEISNVGNQPLTLLDVEIACSCTTVEYPKQPILPGQSASVVVNFNTATVYGRQDREVFLISNDPTGPVSLRYKGVVTGK